MPRDLRRESLVDASKYLEEGMVTFHGIEAKVHCSISKERLVMFPDSWLYEIWLRGDDAGNKEFFTGYSERNLEWIISSMRGEHLSIDLKTNEELQLLVDDFRDLDVEPPQYVLNRISNDNWNNGSKGIYDNLKLLNNNNKENQIMLNELYMLMSKMNTSLDTLKKDNVSLNKEITQLKTENTTLKNAINDIKSSVKAIANDDSTYRSIRSINSTTEDINSSIKNVKEEITKIKTKVESISTSVSFSKSDVTKMNGFENSTILDRNTEYIESLLTWLGMRKKWKLLYRAKSNSFSVSKFHKYCNNKGETVTLIKHIGTKRQINIFGGYTNQSWESPSNKEWKSYSKEFLFTLSNEHDIPPTKYSYTSSNKDYAICCRYDFGPKFGTDICLSDDCNRNKDSYCRAQSFGEYYTTEESSLFVNTGDTNSTNYFTVDDYEVWGRDE
ncbi:hypothetical protein WA158_006889 [Blastocystis sp. Blastoise]